MEQNQALINYDGIGSKAYETLVNFNFSELPVEVLKLNSYAEFKIMTYADGKELLQLLGLSDCLTGRKAITVNYEGKIFIFYDNEISFTERSYVIAHEIGHVMLEHTVTNSIYGKSENPEKENTQELEADVFAMFFLAPAPVLAKINVKFADDLAGICQLPMPVAAKALEYVEKEREHEAINKFQKKLLKNFEETIKQHSFNNDNNENNVFRTVCFETKILEDEVNRLKESITQENSEKETKKLALSVPEIQNKGKRKKTILISSAVIAVIAVIICKFTAFDSIPPADNQNNSIVASASGKESEPAQAEVKAPAAENSVASTGTAVQNNSNGQEIEVVVTPTGTKYHLPDCQHVESKNNLTTMTRNEAIDKGFAPCKTCKPDKK